MSAAGHTGEWAGSISRERAVARYLELRPVIKARLEAAVPVELRHEFASVTAHQLRVLRDLPDDGLTMGQLAEHLQVMAATASVLADRLVAQGLASRQPDAGDRRVVRLVPSAEGRSLADRFARAQEQAAADLFSRLSDSQVDAFLDVLEALAVDSAANDPVRRPALKTDLVAAGTGGAR